MSESSESDTDHGEDVHPLRQDEMPEFTDALLRDLEVSQQTRVLTDFDAFPQLFHLAHPSVIGVVGRSMSGKTTWVSMYFTSAKAVALFEHVYIVARKSQPAYERFVEMYGPDRVTISYVDDARCARLIPDEMMNRNENNLLIMDDLQEFARNKQVIASATQGCHHNNCTTVFLSQSFHVGNKSFRDQVMYWLIFWQPESVVDEIAKSVCGKDKCYQTRFKDMYRRWVRERTEQPQFLLVDCSDTQRLLGEDFQLRPCGLLPEFMPVPKAPTKKERKAMAKLAAMSILRKRRKPVDVEKALTDYQPTRI